MRIVSQMQCFVLFLWAVCKPKMMQSNIKSSWLSWNRWLSTRSVLLVFSSSLGKPLFGRPIGLSIGCSPPCISSSPPSISYLCWSTCWCRPTLRLFSVSASAPASLHDFTVKNIDGEQVEHNFYCLDGQNTFLQVDLAVYKGRACVVVNVASKYFTLLQLAFDLSHLERFFYELDFE